MDITLTAEIERLKKIINSRKDKIQELEEKLKTHESFLTQIREGVDLISKEALWFETPWAKEVLDGIDKLTQKEPT